VFRSIIISPDQPLSGKLAAALEATGHVFIAKNSEAYPTPIDLVRLLRAHAAEILFLSFESTEKALEIVRQVETEAGQVQIVGFHREMDAVVLRDSMRAGVREFLADPFDRPSVMESLSHVKTLLDRRPVTYSVTEQIFSFLPSKAGVGTSTIAAHVGAALARRPNTHVLLSDFDMNSGMLRFMLKLSNEFSVMDAVEHSLAMDSNKWPQLVTDVDGMDVLHAGRLNPNMRIEEPQIRGLVAFMRRNYQALCFDLSGNLEKYSIELMRESKRILLVCTPEIPSLHLAREKVSFLRQLDLENRISVVLNRVDKSPRFSTAQVEEMLELPVIRVFPNDYRAICRSVETAKLLSKTSELGKAFAQFADTLMGQPAERPSKWANKGTKFLEFVAELPAHALPGRE